MEQGLCNGWMSHQLSPVYQPLQQHVAGLLLGATVEGAQQQRHHRSTTHTARQSAANASSAMFIATVER